MTEVGLTDEELVRGLEETSLAPDAFHHAEHVRGAFLFLRRYPVLRAVEQYSEALRRMAASHGKAHRYHQTITWAYMFLIHERMARAGGAPSWEEFGRENPDLLNWQDNIVKRYYSEDRLKSDLARNVFLFPDRVSEFGHASHLRLVSTNFENGRG